MQHIGPLFKRIRKSKGLTLEEVSKDIVSVSFLSKFENEKNDISASNLLALLQRLKVDPKEFYRLVSNCNSTPIQEFIASLTPAFRNDDVRLLNQKLTELDENKNKYDSLFYTHYKILITHFIDHLTDLPINQTNTNTIINYLMANDYWGSYEVYLYTNFIKFIPLDINRLLLKKAKTSAANYVDEGNYKHSVVIIQTNFINKLIKERETFLAIDMINELLDDLNNTPYFYEINKLQYLKGKAMIAQGKITEGKKYTDRAIDIIYQFNNDTLGRAYEKTINNLINSVELELKENS
ncbi:helix-turn-helix domain-containing protein [Ruoffia sp. FAM 20858]|uniref:helix-turn-helix domain-containing protein n=1 Tax=Ruoffia sp. FAM 20858 TaxID=3259516 RepID=UPI00388B929F